MASTGFCLCSEIMYTHYSETAKCFESDWGHKAVRGVILDGIYYKNEDLGPICLCFFLRKKAFFVQLKNMF